jgi:hypothetical protein
MAAVTTPLEQLVTEVHDACGHGMWIVALIAALALPDMCAALEQSDARSTRSRYKAWLAANLPPTSGPILQPDEIYALRCRLLHEGRAQSSSWQTDHQRFALTFEGIQNHGATSFGSAPTGGYVLRWISAPTLIGDLTSAALRWLEASAANPVVQRNMESLAHVEPSDQRGYPWRVIV